MARRGENIHKRKDGRWEGRYIKARTPEGKIQWGYVYGIVYAEVKRVLIQKKAEAGFYNLKRTDLTFEALAEVWLHSQRNAVKASTYAITRTRCTNIFFRFWAKCPLPPLKKVFWNKPCSRSSRLRMPHTSRWGTPLPGNASPCCAASANMPRTCA